MQIYSYIADPEALLALTPEDLAGVVLRFLVGRGERPFSRHDFGHRQTVAGYPDGYQVQLLRALMEAWSWLEREGLIVPTPSAEQSGDWYFVSRRGKQIADTVDFAVYRQGSRLPREALHPLILQKSYAEFLRGDYDMAVFRAFKEVEIAVRSAGKFLPTDLGTDLMRKAFNEITGPLTDQTEPMPERMALAHLFAGAIGRYKNPSSHRSVSLDVAEAVELIMFASHLMKLVDERS